MRRKRFVPLVEELPQFQLPTELSVLGHYLWQLQHQPVRRSSRALARNTVLAVKEIWDRAFIPTGIEGNILRQLLTHKYSVINR